MGARQMLEVRTDIMFILLMEGNEMYWDTKFFLPLVIEIHEQI